MAMIDLRNSFTYAYSTGAATDHNEAVTSAAISTNIIDLDVAGIQPAGSAKPQYLIAYCTVVGATFVSMGIKLITDSVSPVLDAATADDVMIFRFAVGVCTAGALLINNALPHFAYKRYLAIEWEPYTEGTGSFNVFLSDGPESAVTAPAQTVEAGT